MYKCVFSCIMHCSCCKCIAQGKSPPCLLYRHRQIPLDIDGVKRPPILHRLSPLWDHLTCSKSAKIQCKCNLGFVHNPKYALETPITYKSGPTMDQKQHANGTNTGFDNGKWGPSDPAYTGCFPVLYVVAIQPITL